MIVTDDLNRIRDRIAKLERLAADPAAAPGEADNARRMAAATRKKYGIEKEPERPYVSEIGAVFGFRARSPANGQPREMSSLDKYRHQVSTIILFYSARLTAWEKSFIVSVSDRLAADSLLTPKQVSILGALYDKVTTT